jgi:hypothetical protein
MMSVIPFSQKQYNDIAEATFGPIDKYVPANDNIDVREFGARGNVFDESGVSAGFGVGEPRGQYIGLRRSAVDGRTEKVVTFADLVGINYADDESDPVAPILSEGDWQQNAAEADFAFQQGTEPPRHGDFMQTYTGRKFWPMDPRADEVFIEDIAHSLAMQCRYAGHCHRFYSVAEHSVLMARHLRWEGVDVALWALLHDASEAYLVDIPRPVKPYLGGYKEAEAKVMAVVAERFGLAADMPAVVHDADNRIIGDELANLTPMDWHARYNEPLGVTLRYWSPARASEEFMATFTALMDCRARGMEA